ncbi:MAG TPA: response regulator transcription factor [Solirubrobacteraceae bacterium]|nr:response regulator transcription factor [Solirubrobacteraceae bacterium]
MTTVTDDTSMTMTMTPIRTFLCDDVEEFRALIRIAFQGDEQIIVVGEAGDGRAGYEGVRETQPDVVLLDLSMPDLDGLEAIPLMRRACPTAAILVLSGFSAETMGPPVQRAGGDGYVEKGASFDEIRLAVHQAVVDRDADRQAPAFRRWRRRRPR